VNMDIKKCKNCKWFAAMSFCDGKTVDLSRKMCRCNEKECKAVRENQCQFKVK